MENFEKCTVAMLGGPCSQHVTGNTSRLNQPPSAIIKGLITGGRELRQQHPSDLLSGAGTSRERSSRDVPAGQQITRVLLP